MQIEKSGRFFFIPHSLFITALVVLQQSNDRLCVWARRVLPVYHCFSTALQQANIVRHRSITTRTGLTVQYSVYSLAELCFNQTDDWHRRNGEGESIINGKIVRTAAEKNYTNAYNLYSQLTDWNEVIRLQLEKAGLYEFQIKRKSESSSGN